MRRALVLLVLGAAACRPESHGEPLRVMVPAEVGQAPRYALPLDVTLAVPPNTAPRTLRPARDAVVEVPAGEPLPRWMRPQN